MFSFVRRSFVVLTPLLKFKTFKNSKPIVFSNSKSLKFQQFLKLQNSLFLSNFIF